MKTKTIKQSITFPASPDRLYSLLLDSKKLSILHGAPISMTKRKKGKFTVFGGYCHGYNIELIPGEKIEQAWHFSEEGWPDDHFSICIFDLETTSKGTKLTFTQKEVPEVQFEALKEGWYTYYWNPILEYLSH